MVVFDTPVLLNKRELNCKSKVEISFAHSEKAQTATLNLKWNDQLPVSEL